MDEVAEDEDFSSSDIHWNWDWRPSVLWGNASWEELRTKCVDFIPDQIVFVCLKLEETDEAIVKTHNLASLLHFLTVKGLGY